MDATSSFIKNYASDLLSNTDVATINYEIPSLQRVHKRNADKTAVRFFLIGKLAGQHEGSKFGVQGDRKSACHKWFKPVNDEDVVHDVLRLKSFDQEDDPALVKLWDAQLAKLNVIQKPQEFDGRDYVLGKVPRETKSFLKADPECTSNIKMTIDVCWDKYKIPDSRTSVILSKRDRREVRKNVYYEPHVMPLYNPQFFKLDRAKLVQQEFFDEFNYLIAPWDMGTELREGSIVAVQASLCAFDVKLNIGFIRHYELRGIYAKILKRGPGAPTDQTAPSVPDAYKKLHDNFTIHDYAGFSKRS